MPRLIQDFRMELWGFDALMPDGTYLFAIFADVVILGTRHGINIARVFPADGAPWGLVRRVSPNRIGCAADRPEISFGDSYFRREPDRVEVSVQAAVAIKLTYDGPFPAYAPPGPVWEDGERRIRWTVPVLRAPVSVLLPGDPEPQELVGEGIHAYMFADFNPFRPPLRSIHIGHLHADTGAAFYLQAELSNGRSLLHLARQNGSQDVEGAALAPSTCPAGANWSAPEGTLLPADGCMLLSGSPVNLIDGLPGWIQALARQITRGVEMEGWVGRGQLQEQAGTLQGDLIHAGIRWP